MVNKNTTDEKDALRLELEQAKAELHMLSTTVLGGVAKLAIDDRLRVLTASEGYYRMTGYTEAEFGAPPLSAYAADMVVPEDMPHIGEAIERLMKGDTQVNVTYRIWRKDGSIAWNTAYCAQVEQTEAGRVVNVFFRDITEERKCSKENELNEERYRIISEQTRDTVYEWDIATDQIMFSPVFEKMFGYPPPENIPVEKLLELGMLPSEDQPTIEKMMEDVLSGIPYVEYEHQIKNKDGNYLWCRNRATTIFNDERRPVRIIGILSDIDDYKRNTLKLEEQATKDSLTGLLNRMTVQHKIEHYLEKKPNQLCAYVQLDIDHFKQINDFMGHGAGDRALLKITDYLTERFGESSIVGRLGGDEFVVFLPAQPSTEAVISCVSEMRDAVRCDLVTGEKIYPLSISIGVSLFPIHGTTFGELYEHADDALYQAKRQGGNGFVLYSTR